LTTVTTATITDVRFGGGRETRLERGVFINVVHRILTWVDNIKMDLRERRCGGMDWIDLAQDRGSVEGCCEHGYEPSGSIKYWEVLE
jgi:hypothetical protein